RHRVVGVLAAEGHVAGVGRADVVVVAVGRVAADTRAAAALVVGRAGIPVVAGVVVEAVLAAELRVAGVVGAGVVIITVEHHARLAGVVHARLEAGADVHVVALAVVDAAVRDRVAHAPHPLVTEVRGAGGAVVTVDRGMLAAQDVVAGVGRAGIPVVAVEPHGGGMAHARGGVAGLGAVADRIVGAVRVLMAAAREGIVVAHVGRLVARVGGADDVVVAVDRHPLVALAGGEVAGLDAVAEETVVARVGVAAGVRARVTGVLRAGDAVVAVRVGVAAARLGVEVAHARHRVAAVERADVVVVADDVRGVLALAGRGVAGLHARAEIAVGALRIGAAATRDRSVDAGPVAVVGHGVAAVGRADDAVVAGRRRHDSLARAVDAG